MISLLLLLSARGRRGEEMESVLGSITELAIACTKAYGVRIAIQNSTSDGLWTEYGIHYGAPSGPCSRSPIVDWNMPDLKTSFALTLGESLQALHVWPSRKYLPK
jgi:hypothetical protein